MGTSEAEMEEQVQNIVKQVVKQMGGGGGVGGGGEGEKGGYGKGGGKGTKSWRHFPGKNSYDKHGGLNVDLKEDEKNPKYMSVDEAKALCERDGLAGFTYEPGSGRMWRLKEVGRRFGNWSNNPKYDVYVFK